MTSVSRLRALRCAGALAHAFANGQLLGYGRVGSFPGFDLRRLTPGSRLRALRCAGARAISKDVRFCYPGSWTWGASHRFAKGPGCREPRLLGASRLRGRRPCGLPSLARGTEFVYQSHLLHATRTSLGALLGSNHSRASSPVVSPILADLCGFAEVRNVGSAARSVIFVSKRLAWNHERGESDHDSRRDPIQSTST